MPGSTPHSTGLPAPGGGPTQGTAGLPEPQPIGGTVPGGAWSQFLRSLAMDAEFLLLGGALVALCGWFVLENGRDRRDVVHGPVLLVSESVAAAEPPSFAFVGATARETLMPALSPPASDVAAGEVSPSEILFDPLGSLVLSGLPASARLSAGAPVPGADGDAPNWVISFGDLDNLVIELPRDGGRPIRTTFDLHTRAGVKITSMTVELRDRPAGDPAPETGGEVIEETPKSKVRPAKTVRPATKTLRKTARPAAKAVVSKPALVYPGDAPGGKTPLPQPALPVPAPPPFGTGLFKPDPKDTASSGLPEASRDDPRFMTLRGLGMGPAEAPSPPPPAAP